MPRRSALLPVWVWSHHRMSWSQLATPGLIRRRLTSSRCPTESARSFSKCYSAPQDLPTDVSTAAGVLQALNIPTKINKGTVEIAADVQLIQEGNKVGASEATLLAKLGIKPFSYGLVIRQVLLSVRSFNGLPSRLSMVYWT